MNDKDKEAFKEWGADQDGDSPLLKGAAYEAWQAACEYKDKSLINGTRMKQMNEEIERLKAENEKLRKCVDWYADFNSYGTTKNVRPRIPWEKRLISASDVDDSLEGCFPCGGKRARQVLKELEK